MITIYRSDGHCTRVKAVAQRVTRDVVEISVSAASYARVVAWQGEHRAYIAVERRRHVDVKWTKEE